MSGWIYIALSSLCAILVAHVLKVAGHRRLGILRVLAVNYFVCVAISTPFLDTTTVNNLTDISVPFLLLSLFTGTVFVINYFTYSKSVLHNGVGVSISAMRLSLVIPVVLSVFWYGEELQSRQWAGVFTALLVLYLLFPTVRKGKRKGKSFSPLILLLFLLTGAGDSLIKVYEEEMSSLTGDMLFLSLLFSAALVSSLSILVFRNKLTFTSSEIVTGVLLGVPNFLTVLFLLNALSLLGGGVVYTSVNMLTVLGGTFLGFWWWGDKIGKRQGVGIFLTLIAVALLVR